MTVTNLSNSQVIRLKEEFSVLDADNRGTINFDSLLALYYELDVATDKDELEQLVGSKAVEANLFDIDAALQTYGKLNELAIQRQQEREAQLRHAFKLFDRDHDGKVTAEELQMIMTHVTKEQYTTDEAAELVTILDTDKNGFIDVDELLGLIKSRGEVAAS
ncbi:hypothetical protein BDF22DRAFT_772999 [Syncephalis plumigaleata]|nr:hypothetical protein BDF22DRAFT_772999 [Syncephalis plumigaleata]